jgi:L-lactate dehydrogenase complex protein LldE
MAMKIGLFVSCYVNELYPDVAMATLELLEAYGLEVTYPMEQTCCGQLLANNGHSAGACQAEQRFAHVFAPFDYVVGPSSSCVAHVRKHAQPELKRNAQYQNVANKTFELIEFLQTVLKVEALPTPVSFPHVVSVHQSCHGLRDIHHGAASELNIPYFSRLERALSWVDDVTVVLPERRDECCGFGGSFAVEQPAVSVAMGQDRVAQHQATGAHFIVGADASCLMHMQAIARYNGAPIRPVHIAQILTGRGGV